MNLRPFHLAIPVDDIETAKEFYGSKLGFAEGRSDDHWVDYNFFGHQLFATLVNQTALLMKLMVKMCQFLILEFCWDGMSLITFQIHSKKTTFNLSLNPI